MLDTVSWLQDHVIYLKYGGIVTLETVRDGSEKVAGMMQLRNLETIHLIIDLTEKRGIGDGLTNVAKLAEATRVYRRQQQNGWTIFVEQLPDIALRFTCRVVFLAARLPIHHVHSLAEAELYLTQADAIRERKLANPSRTRRAQRKRPL